MRATSRPVLAATLPGLLALAAAAGEPDAGGAMTALEITSPAFESMGEIPRRFTCEGDDVSPELRWSGVPDGAASLVLVVDDPDAPDPKAPRVRWVHWILYDIPAHAAGLPEAVASSGLPAGTREGRNDWRRTGYGGPCPPVGRHRYFHRLYALDVELGELGEPSRADLERAMEGHVLAQAELVATYEKQGR